MARIFLILFSGLFFAFCMHTSPTEANPVFPAVPTVWYTKELVSLNGKPVHQQALGFDKKIILLENKNGLLPLNRLDLNIAHISIGGNSAAFQQGMERFTHTESFLRTSISPEEMKEWMKDKALDMLIISVHATKEAKTDSLNTDFLKAIPDNIKTLLVVFGDESVLSKLPTKQFDGVLWAKENHQIAQDRTSQVLFGGLAITGELSKEINTKDQVFMANTGFQTMTNGRLSFGSPEEIGIDSKKLKAIDEIANDGIEKGAYPGCQIVVAVNDHIIWRKCYGKQSYDQKAPSVKDEDVYDIASITKIAGSTLLAMHLQSQGKYELDKKLNEYIPELTGNSPFGNIVIRDMMAHQAGLTPFIPFYKKTMQNGEWNPAIYSKIKKDGFSKQVAEGMFMNDSYVDSMYAQILKSTLGPKKYEYSDLCYYFTQKILEKQIGQKQNVFLEANIYRPMGLRYMRYLPLNFFDPLHIAPTENDQSFRKQLLRGYVHDPGAAMLGGVAGHAGIFANATDLASIMQLFLNKGKYAGMEFFNEAVCNEYTKQQFPGNRRGVGFDRPNASGGGTCDELASQQSFGHSGFTGTLAWADPKNKIVFIFLSNRVNPNQENWKIRDMGIRTKIQHVVYQALQ